MYRGKVPGDWVHTNAVSAWLATSYLEVHTSARLPLVDKCQVIAPFQRKKALPKHWPSCRCHVRVNKGEPVWGTPPFNKVLR